MQNSKYYSDTDIVSSKRKEKKKIKDALTLASKFFDPRENPFVAIICLDRKGYDNLYFPEKKIYILQKPTVIESSVEYLASLLVHEYAHFLQYSKKKKFTGDRAEKEAYERQKKFLKKFGSKDEVAWLDHLFKNEPWWKFKSRNGKTFVSPKEKLFRKILRKYESEKK